jgi:hypothetical protein
MSRNSEFFYFQRKELKMATPKMPTDPDEIVVDKILENLVIAMEGYGLARATIARGMICAAAGLMISDSDHGATSKALRAYADSVDRLAVRGTA